jgi:hypothetical protein
MQKFNYRNSANVEHEMFCHCHWNHRNFNQKTKTISGNDTRKAFNRISTKKTSCTRNTTHYKESATIRNLKPEWCGSPLVQEEKYQEKPVKKKKK